MQCIVSNYTRLCRKKFYYLCPNRKPNQQLSYSLGENQPTNKILLFGTPERKIESYNYINLSPSSLCSYCQSTDRDYTCNLHKFYILRIFRWAVDYVLLCWSIWFNLADNLLKLQNSIVLMFQTVLSCWLSRIRLIQILLNVDVTFSEASFLSVIAT